jgi:N-acetylneuraminic acid mutarotase
MVYMYGGWDIMNGDPVALCQRYDRSADTWFDMASMAVGRGRIKGIYLQGRLYALGGQTDSSPRVSACEAYDIATNTWSAIADLPTGVSDYQAVAWRDSLLILMGGKIPPGTTSNLVWIYNPLTETWTSGDTMPAPCSDGDACVISDTIYFAGGIGEVTDTRMRVGVIQRSSPVRITWCR